VQLVGLRIEVQLSDLKRVLFLTCAGLAFHHRVDAEQEFLVVKGFGDVVIGATFEPADPVLHPAPRRQQNDGQLRVDLAEVLGQGEAIPSRQHDVEQRDVESPGMVGRQRFTAIAHQRHLEPLQSQQVVQQQPQGRVVLHHEDMYRRFRHGVDLEVGP